jgi:hypothetical protein
MFRFTIRDVLWLTALVAVSLACFVQRVTLEQARLEAARSRYDVERLVRMLKESGYRVMWEDELGTMGAVGTDPLLRPASNRLIADPAPRLPLPWATTRSTSDDVR